MTRKEFLPISASLIAAYPNAKILGDKASLEFWYRMLEDLDASVVENSVMEHIATNTFPPSIAEIRKLCTDRTSAPVLSADEAWGTVQNAMSRYGYYHPQEAFATMDDLTVSIVKNLGWTRLCQSENPTADRANFRMAYEEKAKARRNAMQLPAFVEEKRARLQQQYIPAVTAKPEIGIEQKEETENRREEMTDEQRENISRRIKEVQRRLSGGTKETE
jgi:hypothetical protein